MAQDIEKDFKSAIAQLKSDITLAGTTLTQVCKDVGCGRSTPDLWVAKTPATIRLLKRMQDLVAKKLAEADK